MGAITLAALLSPLSPDLGKSPRAAWGSQAGSGRLTSVFPASSAIRRAPTCLPCLASHACSECLSRAQRSCCARVRPFAGYGGLAHLCRSTRRAADLCVPMQRHVATPLCDPCRASLAAARPRELAMSTRSATAFATRRLLNDDHGMSTLRTALTQPVCPASDDDALARERLSFHVDASDLRAMCSAIHSRRSSAVYALDTRLQQADARAVPDRPAARPRPASRPASLRDRSRSARHLSRAELRLRRRRARPHLLGRPAQ